MPAVVALAAQQSRGGLVPHATLHEHFLPRSAYGHGLARLAGVHTSNTLGHQALHHSYHAHITHSKHPGRFADALEEESSGTPHSPTAELTDTVPQRTLIPHLELDDDQHCGVEQSDDSSPLETKRRNIFRRHLSAVTLIGFSLFVLALIFKLQHQPFGHILIGARNSTLTYTQNYESVIFTVNRENLLYNPLLIYFTSIFQKVYAVYFLLLLISVSFICDKLFGCHISVGHYHSESSKLEKHYDDSLKNCEHEIQLESVVANKTDLKVAIVYFLPLRLLSRLWGYLNQVKLPHATRRPLYLWYSHTFGCNLDEIEVQDLSQFANLSQFFRRSLKPGVRPIGEENGIVSPADGRIVQLEAVAPDGYVGSVKGIYYSVDYFLGQIQKPSRLYSCVVYLAPGDYHRFHSPVEWTVHWRRHFAGKLLSVKPSFVARVTNLFAIQERVVYFGQWQYGFFAMAAVGATNVGSVNVFFDSELKTNQAYLKSQYQTEKHFETPIKMAKGQLFGEFNLGSTIVLIYEAPEGQHFKFLPQQKVKYGQSLCTIDCH